MKRNHNLASLKTNYLFPEINLRKKQFLEQNPNAKLIHLGIGDTTGPIPQEVAAALARASQALGTKEGYTGYGAEQGMQALREKIAHVIYSNQVQADEIFVSDGAKCDLGRLQVLFGNNISVAIQDPAYPVYIDGSLIQGVNKIVPMLCSPENHFFPNLEALPKVDVIYFCSPNNPTGAAATRSQLEQLVQFAENNRTLIVYDAAYANYIQDPNLPKSIFEIPGARKVSIEVNSFSKLAGFTGIRLGWTVVPEELHYDDGSSVRADWNRLMCTLFNGASNIAQSGGCAVLEEDGLKAIAAMTNYYMENARILKMALQNLRAEVFGGTHAPYIWVRFKEHQSWKIFQYFLEHYHLITTPGSGFGRKGEGFIRITAFGHRQTILETVKRLGYNSEDFSIVLHP